MKKNTLILLFSVISFSTFSQMSFFGLNAGLGISGNSHLYPGYHNRGFGYREFGMRLLRVTKSPFVYGLHFGYSLEGARLHAQWEQPFANRIDLRARLEYLRLCFKGGYLFGKPFSTIRFIAFAGPNVGHLLYGHEVHDITHPGGTEHFEKNTTSLYNQRVDIGVQGGVGLHYALSTNKIFCADLVYYKGFRNMLDVYRKNTNAAVSVGALWKIGGRKHKTHADRN